MSVSAHDAAASTSALKTSTSGHEASIVSSCLACAPVTALQFLSPSNLLVAAQGPYLKLYDVYQPQEVLAQTKLWSFQRIHGIVRYPHTSSKSRERFLVFGGKHAAIVHCDREEQVFSFEHGWVASDWLLAGAWLKKDSILLLTSHNTLLSYRFSSEDHVPTLSHELHCHERPLLWSACFSQSHYASLENVYVAVGTIMNEILVWRPHTGQGEIERRLIGHHGSVFFVTFAPKAGEEEEYCLASGSDDRDVRLWRWKNGSEAYTTSILQGHSHRPWRAAFTRDGKTLVTVGEDLRCLIWDATIASEQGTHSPSGQYKGHEGKSIWCTAISEDLSYIATGGSDGAIRLCPLEAKDTALPIFTVKDRNLIVNFDINEKHVVLLTKQGDVYHTPVGVKSLERSLLFHVEATRGKVQGELKICKDSVWLWTRDGTVYRKLLKADQPLKVQKLDVMPVIIASSPSGKYWAIYDGRKRNVQIWSEDSDNVLHEVESEALELSRIPKYLDWLDDEKVVLADPVASIWVMSWNGEAGKLDTVFSGRLSIKGIFALQRDDASRDNFWVGHKDSSVLYRICRIEGQASLQAVNTQCLHQGALKEVHPASSRMDRLYQACDNTSGRAISENGDVLFNLKCPGSSAQTLQSVIVDDGIHFYCNTGTQLCYFQASLHVAPILQQGVQGREIWSVDLYQSPASKRILCATSAEDNTIKISEYIYRGYDGEAHGTSDLKTLHRFPDPDGTLQNVCWAESVHEEDETVLLFVTAAKERLYALRVQLSASTSNIKVVRLGEVARERSVSEDSRTMALDVVKLSTTDDQTDEHAILVGSSDGSLKLWYFDELSGSFKQQWSSSWHDRCLLSVKLLQHRKRIWAISGATDGRLAVWDLHGKSELPVWTSDGVHQSGVNCLDAIFEGDNLHIVSGGDDCSMAYTLLEPSRSSSQVRRARVDAAHSSSIKGVAMLGPWLAVSTSTDQRATMFRIAFDTQGGLRMRKLASVVTSVADVADLAVLRPTGRPPLMAISGIGLELLQLPASQGS